MSNEKKIDELIIIQTWKSYELPEHLYNLAIKVKSNNPNSMYCFYTDDTIIKFIKKIFPEYYETFINFKYKIQQIDFFRYLVIYYYGGLYLDLDMDINTYINIVDRSKCIFPVELGGKNNPNMLIGNYAFYAPAKHPFLKYIIDCIVKPIISDEEIVDRQNIHSDPKEHVYVYFTTGPELITRAYQMYNNKDEIILLEPSGEFCKDCFGDFGKHCSYGSWKHPNTDAKI